MSASARPSRTDAILKAIDEEHRDNVRGAQAIYDERMKPARTAKEQARRAWNAALAAFAAEEQKHDAERKENVAEAQARRIDLRQAVLGAKPTSGIPKVTARPADAGSPGGSGSPISLPRLSCLERRS